jgi:hypothetical protein
VTAIKLSQLILTEGIIFVDVKAFGYYSMAFEFLSWPSQDCSNANQSRTLVHYITVAVKLPTVRKILENVPRMRRQLRPCPLSIHAAASISGLIIEGFTSMTHDSTPPPPALYTAYRKKNKVLNYVVPSA